MSALIALVLDRYMSETVHDYEVSNGTGGVIGQALNIDLGVKFNVEGDGKRSVGARLGISGRF